MVDRFCLYFLLGDPRGAYAIALIPSFSIVPRSLLCWKYALHSIWKFKTQR